MDSPKNYICEVAAMKRFLLFAVLFAALALLAIPAAAADVPDEPGLYFVETDWGYDPDYGGYRHVLSEYPNPRNTEERSFSGSLWFSLAYFDGSTYTLLCEEAADLDWYGPASRLDFDIIGKHYAEFCDTGILTFTYQGQYSAYLSVVMPEYGAFTSPEASVSSCIANGQYNANTYGSVFYIAARDDVSPIAAVDVDRYPEYYSFQKINDRLWSVTVSDEAEGEWFDWFNICAGDGNWQSISLALTKMNPGLYFVYTETDYDTWKQVVAENPGPRNAETFGYRADGCPENTALAFFDGSTYTLITDTDELVFSSDAAKFEPDGDNRFYVYTQALGTMNVTYRGQYSVSVTVDYPYIGIYRGQTPSVSDMITVFDPTKGTDTFYIVTRNSGEHFVDCYAEDFPAYFTITEISDTVRAVTVGDLPIGEWDVQFGGETESETMGFVTSCRIRIRNIPQDLYIVNTVCIYKPNTGETVFYVDSDYPDPRKTESFSYSGTGTQFLGLAWYDGNDYTLLTDDTGITFSGCLAEFEFGSENIFWFRPSGVGTATVTYQGKYSVSIEISLPDVALYKTQTPSFSSMFRSFDGSADGNTFYVIAAAEDGFIYSVTPEDHPGYYTCERLSDRVWSVTFTDSAAGSWYEYFQIICGPMGDAYNSCSADFVNHVPGLYFVNTAWNGQKTIVANNPMPNKAVSFVYSANGSAELSPAYFDGTDYTLLSSPEGFTWSGSLITGLSAGNDGLIIHYGGSEGESTLTYRGSSVTVRMTVPEIAVYTSPTADIRYYYGEIGSTLIFTDDTDTLYIAAKAGIEQLNDVRISLTDTDYNPLDCMEVTRVSDTVWALRLSDSAPAGTMYYNPRYNYIQLEEWGKTTTFSPMYTYDLVILNRKNGLRAGDINGDGNVDILDAVLLLQNFMYPETYPVSYAGTTDFNGDGVKDIKDAALLLQYSLFPELYPLA